MEQPPKTSFIPKQAAGGAPLRQRKSFNILAFFTIVIFLATLALSVGVFFYKKHVDQQLVKEKAELTKLRLTFSYDEIEALRTFENRVKSAEQVLGTHLSLTKVFDALEDRTQEKTQLTDFTFTLLDSGIADVSLSGSSVSFNTVALQKRAFGGETIFEKGSVVFSDFAALIGEGATKAVTFKVVAALNKPSILYSVTSISTTTNATTSTMTTATTSATMSTTTRAMPARATTAATTTRTGSATTTTP